MKATHLAPLSMVSLDGSQAGTKDRAQVCVVNTFKPHLHARKKSALHAKLLAPCLCPCRDYLREVAGGSLGIPKILSSGATLHLRPIGLHVENWECRALKSSARCQKFAVPCRFF